MECFRAHGGLTSGAAQKRPKGQKFGVEDDIFGGREEKISEKGRRKSEKEKKRGEKEKKEEEGEEVCSKFRLLRKILEAVDERP